MTRRRYDRQAWWYDLHNAPLERLAFRKWRARLWSEVKGGRVLEIGVGTGANFPYYPAGAEVTAIDLSEKMLDRARRRAARDGMRVALQVMDAERLEFPDASFDAVVAAFVFCSVPDPVQGLREAARVLRPDGRLHLLEHVRSEGSLVGRLIDWLNPLVVRIMGANINRRTAENVLRAGLTVEHTDPLFRDIVQLLVARKG